MVLATVTVYLMVSLPKIPYIRGSGQPCKYYVTPKPAMKSFSLLIF